MNQQKLFGKHNSAKIDSLMKCRIFKMTIRRVKPKIQRKIMTSKAKISVFSVSTDPASRVSIIKNNLWAVSLNVPTNRHESIPINILIKKLKTMNMIEL